ncbi:MAG: restriction endonuclease subunit S [Epsilonproteobacteria bacterium]|nr:restriction endonuclease subunit S [Campylobacterota bacterium]
MKSNIPELRFSEFKNEPEWEEKTLSDISDFINEKISLNKLTLNNYISTENLLQDFSGVAISSKLPDVKTVTHFKKNDILISNIRPYLKKVWSATFDGGASNDVIVVRAKENTNNNFLTYVLKNEKFISYIMEGAKGVKMPRGDISLIKKYPLSISPKPKEQQKIADCLSSLDNLITAQSKKVGALKEHKKGLMQQLFPQDGEEVPKLRFPEFKNSGKWEEKTLGNAGKVSMCKRIMKDETTETGEIPFYKIGTFGKKADAYIDKELYEEYKEKYSFPKKGDILISASGTIGRLVVYDGLPAYFQDSNIVWIDNNEEIVINSFLFFFYETVKWTTSDSTIARLYNDNLRSVQILKPSIKEQQKIAECLSSIDELITSSSKKIETLKEHKKALMQQLFPSNEGNK